MSQNDESLLLVHPAWTTLCEGFLGRQSPSPGGTNGAKRGMSRSESSLRIWVVGNPS